MYFNLFRLREHEYSREISACFRIRKYFLFQLNSKISIPSSKATCFILLSRIISGQEIDLADCIK